MTCPKCGFEQPAGAPDCARCGVIFAKLQREAAAGPPTNDAVAAWDAVAPADEQPRPAASAPSLVELPPPRIAKTSGRYSPPQISKDSQPLSEVYDGRFAEQSRDAELEFEEGAIANGRLGPKEAIILGAGLLVALGAYVVPLTRFVLSALITLFHEFGHAVAGWLLGMPSLPAFDFVYGGGWTHTGGFHLSIALAVAGGFAYLAYLFRQNVKTVALIGSLFVFWLVFVSAEWRRELAFSAAGHVAEFILAGIFFYQALAGVGWRMPEVERPIGAFIAFFVQIHSMIFSWRLMHDPDFLAWYKEGKGGAAMNDLEVVALDLNIYAKLNPGIEGVARMLLLFSFVPIIVALVWYFQRARWHRVMRSLRMATA